MKNYLLRRLRNIAFCFVLLFLTLSAFSQTRFSLATDVNVLRSFKKGQQYWSIGQTVHGHFHFSKRDGAYAWISYYTNGKFQNNVTAVAVSPTTIPQEVQYRNEALVRFKHISLGWKRYWKGDPAAEGGWNLYTLAGFGLVLGTAENKHNPVVDEAVYTTPVVSGKGNFKRLTLDLGLGIEKPVGADVFLYLESRALIPTTDYPSKYLFVNDNAPFTATVNAGLRILF